MSLTHLEVLNGAHKECYWQQLPECFFFFTQYHQQWEL